MTQRGEPLLLELLKAANTRDRAKSSGHVVSERPHCKFWGGKKTWHIHIWRMFSLKDVNPGWLRKLTCRCFILFKKNKKNKNEKEPGWTVKPIKVAVITARGPLHNTTNAIISFLLCPLGKSCSSPRNIRPHDPEKFYPRKAEKSRCCDCVRQRFQQRAAFFFSIPEAVIIWALETKIITIIIKIFCCLVLFTAIVPAGLATLSNKVEP